MAETLKNVKVNVVLALEGLDEAVNRGTRQRLLTSLRRAREHLNEAIIEWEDVRKERAEPSAHGADIALIDDCLIAARDDLHYVNQLIREVYPNGA